MIIIYIKILGLTGADSIVSTFKRAKYNFDLMESGQGLPIPPPPPSLFNISSGGDRIMIDWSNESESHQDFLDITYIV